MKTTLRERRVRDYERGLGSCTCESLGVCALCTASRTLLWGDDGTDTSNEAATPPCSTFNLHAGSDHE
jgi:hypothetical protein